VIDFDAATKDPSNPKQILPAFNIRDHLHPNDAGYKAMADAIDLSLFTTSKKK
jgi:lysophospholipase L1-like esterase